MEERKDHKAIITFIAIVVIAIIVVTAVVASPKKKVTNSATATGTSNKTSQPTPVATASFKNGSYSATGSYESPGGNEQLTVHVTLQNGVVTAASVDSGAQDPEASEYQGMFISGYKAQVIGKNITAIHLSRVSGSSLTSQGFNDAISQIENQAKT